MKIALIGWGSLVKPNWEFDGPILPLEFSRVSNSGLLTLVIDPEHGTRTKTFYRKSRRKDIMDAIADMRGWERTLMSNISFAYSYSYYEDGSLKAEVSSWCDEHGFDAAVWTGLPPNFGDETGFREFSIANAHMHLGRLPKSLRKRAYKYIDKKVPAQIETAFRTDHNLFMGRMNNETPNIRA